MAVDTDEGGILEATLTGAVSTPTYVCRDVLAPSVDVSTRSLRISRSIWPGYCPAPEVSERHGPAGRSTSPCCNNADRLGRGEAYQSDTRVEAEVAAVPHEAHPRQRLSFTSRFGLGRNVQVLCDSRAAWADQLIMSECTMRVKIVHINASNLGAANPRRECSLPSQRRPASPSHPLAPRRSPGNGIRACW